MPSPKSKMPAGPHDRFWLRMMTRPEILDEVVLVLLPPDLAGILEPGSLRAEQENSVRRGFRRSSMDLVVSARSGGRAITLYFVMEHKSREERRVWIQLSGYLQSCLKRQEDPEQFFPVIPVIFHHGRKPWSGVRRFSERFGEVPPAVAPHLPDFCPVIIDLAGPGPEREWAGMSVVVQAFLTLLREAWTRDREAVLRRVAPLWNAILDKEPVQDMPEYFLALAEGEPDEQDRLLDLIGQELSGKEEDVMGSLLDRLKREGHALGRQEGRQEGFEEARREDVLKLLRKGILSPRQIAEVLEVDDAWIREIADSQDSGR